MRMQTMGLSHAFMINTSALVRLTCNLETKKKFFCCFLSLLLQFFVLCHSLLQLAQLLVSGYMKSSISTIERRYGLNSRKSGLLAAFNEVSSCLDSFYLTAASPHSFLSHDVTFCLSGCTRVLTMCSTTTCVQMFELNVLQWQFLLPYSNQFQKFDLSNPCLPLQVGNTVLIVFVSFFGSRVHRPRFIGGGALLACVASLLMAIPHFLSGPYEYTDRISCKTQLEWTCLKGNLTTIMFNMDFTSVATKLFFPFGNSLQWQQLWPLPSGEHPGQHFLWAELQPGGESHPACCLSTAAAGPTAAGNCNCTHTAIRYFLHWRLCEQEELTTLPRWENESSFNVWRMGQIYMVSLVCCDCPHLKSLKNAGLNFKNKLLYTSWHLLCATAVVQHNRQSASDTVL